MESGDKEQDDTSRMESGDKEQDDCQIYASPRGFEKLDRNSMKFEICTERALLYGAFEIPYQQSHSLPHSSKTKYTGTPRCGQHPSHSTLPN
jgi:hypothetical protein